MTFDLIQVCGAIQLNSISMDSSQWQWIDLKLKQVFMGHLTRCYSMDRSLWYLSVAIVQVVVAKFLVASNGTKQFSSMLIRVMVGQWMDM